VHLPGDVRDARRLRDARARPIAAGCRSRVEVGRGARWAARGIVHRRARRRDAVYDAVADWGAIRCEIRRAAGPAQAFPLPGRRAPRRDPPQLGRARRARSISAWTWAGARRVHARDNRALRAAARLPAAANGRPHRADATDPACWRVPRSSRPTRASTRSSSRSPPCSRRDRSGPARRTGPVAGAPEGRGSGAHSGRWSTPSGRPGARLRGPSVALRSGLPGRATARRALARAGHHAPAPSAPRRHLPPAVAQAFLSEWEASAARPAACPSSTRCSSPPRRRPRRGGQIGYPVVVKISPAALPTSPTGGVARAARPRRGREACRHRRQVRAKAPDVASRAS
jgi:hypothetical protein